MKHRFLFITGIFLLVFGVSAQQSPLVLYPDASEDGSMISFSYQGDIWLAPFEGGDARRLTIHEGYDGMPKFSPDGKYIAFYSERFGNADAYIINTEGGSAKQLTYHSAGDLPTSWIGNDEILIETRRVFAQVERTREIHSVNVSGGTPERFLNALGFHAVASPNGKFIAFERGSCRREREAYRGSANRNIWIYDIENDKYNQITTDNGQDIFPRWANNETLFFLSARSGKYNVHEVVIGSDGKSSSSPEQVSDFSDFGILYYDYSPGNSSFVFTRKDKLYRSNKDFTEVNDIKLNVYSDFKFDPVEYKNVSGDISDFSISPNGKYTVFSTNGEIFIKKNDKEIKRTVRVTKGAFRDQEPKWLNDSTILFISDKDGHFEIYKAISDDPSTTNLFASIKFKIEKLFNSDDDVNFFTVAPNGEHIAYVVGRGDLNTAVVNENGISDKKDLLDGWATPRSLSFSPDSRWLAYSLDDLNFNEEVYIHAADNSKDPVNISMHPKGDYSPVWSKDGSKLAFLSGRNNGDNDVWFLWLKKSDWEKTRQDWQEIKALKSDDQEKKNGNGSKNGETDVEPITIDFEDIYERLSQVTSLPGNESGLQVSNDGEEMYFTTNNDGRQSYDADIDIYKVNWDGTEMKSLTSGNEEARGLTLEPSGKHLYYVKNGGRLMKISTDGKKESQPFSASMEVDYEAVTQQMFNEATRILGRRFYDPNFHGENWETLVETYKPWIMKASNKVDFRYMFNNMLGQLNASHMGLYGGSRAETQNIRTGLLGVETKYTNKGLEVVKVVKESPADRTDSKINVGDVIISIDGNEVNDEVSMYAYLINKAGERVLMRVQSGKDDKDIIIRPSASLRNELYDEWVDERRELTKKYSDGKLGYLHIRGMNWTSFERFERELMAAGNGKEGIVIDVRFNGGGWTTDYLMAVLNVKQHAYTIPRGATDDLKEKNVEFKNNYPFGERLPLSSWTKPSIALCNQNSYSNAEIFSHAYKQLDIGTLVGTPTFGAVISTGGTRLVDGSYLRLPFRAWYVYETGKNMELNGAIPDIIVENDPDSKANGEDEQLEKAVDELVSQLSK
ncbi:S41 family peptidase [Mangrovivirga cuniculi]|uniref:Tricorn protease homolog n=1 Tax=Mangrovivirga cuniculi TaxID=2715131 RepID=A0A4D7JI11_9BACT|nr:S41 family peptidase [Mangrovivirga cuniculi]QCK15271.1 peptidase S41 [Mangrovivirga cuniculi]